LILGNLSSLPKYEGKLSGGDTVVVTFTVNWYPRGPKSESQDEGSLKRVEERGYDRVLSFNIQDIVLLVKGASDE